MYKHNKELQKMDNELVGEMRFRRTQYDRAIQAWVKVHRAAGSRSMDRVKIQWEQVRQKYDTFSRSRKISRSPLERLEWAKSTGRRFQTELLIFLQIVQNYC